MPCPSLTTRNFQDLLTFLHGRVSPTLQSLSSQTSSTAPFFTFVVGSGQHPMAPAALHSHLVGCATAPDTSEYHGTLYVPVGPGESWHCPPEWAPTFVYLAAVLLWPDLPFLVCSPAYRLGAHTTLMELRTTFTNPGSLTCFSSAKSLCRNDAFLRLPPAVPFHASDGSTDIPFRSHTPEEAMAALDTVSRDHVQNHQPGDLLSLISSPYPRWLSVYPGDGVFFRPLSSDLAAKRPFAASWLYFLTEDSCPPPPYFVSFTSTLSQHSPEVVSLDGQVWL